MKKLTSSALVVCMPFLFSCSALSSFTGYSSDPVVAEQQRRIETLKEEVKRAELDTEEAEQKEKAAKSRLRAAEDQLKVLQTEAKRRTS